jgi:hypothetical protein
MRYGLKEEVKSDIVWGRRSLSNTLIACWIEKRNDQCISQFCLQKPSIDDALLPASTQTWHWARKEMCAMKALLHELIPHHTFIFHSYMETLHHTSCKN